MKAEQGKLHNVLFAACSSRDGCHRRRRHPTYDGGGPFVQPLCSCATLLPSFLPRNLNGRKKEEEEEEWIEGVAQQDSNWKICMLTLLVISVPRQQTELYHFHFQCKILYVHLVEEGYSSWETI